MDRLAHRARVRWEHRWAPRHMSAYLDGELAAGARLRLERHVVECEACRATLAGLRAMLAALRRLPSSAGGDPVALAASVSRRLGEPSG